MTPHHVNGVTKPHGAFPGEPSPVRCIVHRNAFPCRLCAGNRAKAKRRQGVVSAVLTLACLMAVTGLVWAIAWLEGR